MAISTPHQLNGKYKMRATEVTFKSLAVSGAHDHVGPAPIYPALERGCRASAAGPTQLSFYGPPVSTTQRNG